MPSTPPAAHRRAAWRLLCVAAALSGCTEYELETWEQVEVFHQNPTAQVDIGFVCFAACDLLRDMGYVP